MRIVIVESTPVLREYLARSCREKLGHEVVGLCRSGREAWEVISRSRPDLVLLELSRHPEEGFLVAANVARDLPGVRCLFMSDHCAESVVRRVERSRAVGFIDRSKAGLEEFRTALAAVEAGRPYHSESYRQMVAQIRGAEVVAEPGLVESVPFAFSARPYQMHGSVTMGTEAAAGLARNASLIDFAQYAKTSVSTIVFNVACAIICGYSQLVYFAADICDDCPV
ncbi:MAG: response regulator transcription factor [Opitutales bacterium]